ncbi:MAG TPA: SBBP repeat-containing protein [Verrucomicrobiae bacterium]|nr:SBBP repeat-containing protein [Verrucomicrobiae bacterium]
MKKISFAIALAAFAAQAQHVALPGNLPLSFENSAADQFAARGVNYQFQITPSSAEMTLQKMDGETARAQMHLAGANPLAQISGDAELPGKINYLVGDKSQWRTDLSTFAKVRVAGVYRGVDLVYYGNGRQLEYDFTVAPGANPDAIRFQFTGVDKLSVNAGGDLVLSAGKGEIIEHAPKIYQMTGNTRREISGGYKLLDKDTVAFSIGQYDRGLPLVIDPVLAYSTYFGGIGSDTGWSVAVDADGNVYIAGETKSSLRIFSYKSGSLATPGAFQTKFKGGKLTGDAFVAKFDSTLTNLIYCTYLGGKGDDGAFGIAVANGNAYVTGFTQSRDFPVANALYPGLTGKIDRRIWALPTDAFVTVLDAGGSNLLFSTYLGGSSTDSGVGIALDSSANIYVTGLTESKNFPTVNPLPGQDALSGSSAAFVTEIFNDFSGIAFSTYLGGNRDDEGEGIAVGADNSIFVTGFTTSSNFPTNNPIQSELNRGVLSATLKGWDSDAFLAKLSPGGAGLDFSTYFGGTNNDKAFGIALDSVENVYIVGQTSSRDFWNTNALTVADGTNVIYGLHTPKFGGLSADAFLAKFEPTGALDYSVKFGGSSDDLAYAVAADAAGDVVLTGTTSSTNFPVLVPAGTTGFPNPSKRSAYGAHDIFVASVSSDNSNLVYSLYAGGRKNDYAYGIAVDASTNVYVTGETLAPNFPLTNAVQKKLNGGYDAFLMKIEP